MLSRKSSCPNCKSKDAKLIYKFPSGHYVRCTQCSLISIDPLPGNDQMLARSEYWAIEHHKKEMKVEQHYSQEFQDFAYKEYFDRMASFKKTGRVLDIGCGIGSFVHAAERMGWDAYGIDIGPSISVAKEHDLRVYQGRLQDVHFPNNHFDVITMFDVIEHINDLDDLFQGIHEKLRPNGLLVIKTPNFNSIPSKLLGREWSAVEPLDHLILFSPKSIESFLTKRSYELINLNTIDLDLYDILNKLRKNSKKQEKIGSEKSKRKLIHALTKNKGLQVTRKIINTLLSVLNLGESLIVYARLE